jgi:hypothetical protein
MSGQAVAWSGIERIIEAFRLIELRAKRWSCTRIDLALDTQAFTVEQFWLAVGENTWPIVTHVHRKSIERYHKRGYRLHGREGIADAPAHLQEDHSR